MGQGTVSALRQIVAEELGIEPEKVRVSPLRPTNLVPYTWQTVGSRGLYSDGQALMRALDDLKSQIRKVAAQIFKVFEDEIEIKDGKAYVKGKPWDSVTLAEIALGYMFPDGETIHGPLIGRGSHVPVQTTFLDPETGAGEPKPFITFGAGAVEVEVDLLNMQVKVIRAATVYDTPVINPGLAYGQVYGGLIMGMGLALTEQLVFDDHGRLLNPNLTDYKVFRAGDIPKEIKAEFLGVGQRNAPYGAKGIGELTMLAWPAAIINAIYDAIGVRVKETPVTPDKLLKEIKEQKPELLEEVRKQLLG